MHDRIELPDGHGQSRLFIKEPECELVEQAADIAHVFRTRELDSIAERIIELIER